MGGRLAVFAFGLGELQTNKQSICNFYSIFFKSDVNICYCAMLGLKATDGGGKGGDRGRCGKEVLSYVSWYESC